MKEETGKGKGEKKVDDGVRGRGKVGRVVEKEVTVSVSWILLRIHGVHLVDHSLVKIIVEMEPF